MHVITPLAGPGAELVRTLVDGATHRTAVLVRERAAGISQYEYAPVRRNHGELSEVWDVLAAPDLV